MKSATFGSCVTLVLLLVTPWLGAQTAGQAPAKMTVDVPFDFMVEQVMFPAGNYTVRPVQGRTFCLQAGHGRESVSIATQPIRTALHPRTARLIFAEENGHFHLRELWMNSATGAEAPGRRAEHLRMVRESPVEVPARCPTCE